MPGVQHTQLVPGMGAWDEVWGGGHCAQKGEGPLLLPEPWELGPGRGLWGLSLAPA